MQGTPLRVTVSGGEAHTELIGDPITVLDAGRVIWTDISGQALACDDPSTARQHSERLIDTIGNIAALGDRLAVATPAGIDIVNPPETCGANTGGSLPPTH